MKTVMLTMFVMLAAGCLLTQEPPAGDSGVLDDPDAPVAMAVDSTPTTWPTPIGTWTITYTWTLQGDCGFAAPVTRPFSVISQTGQYTYLMHDSDPMVQQVTGLMDCIDSHCQLTMHEAGRTIPVGTAQSGVQDAILTLWHDGTITGQGGMAFRFANDTECNQQFTATGTRS